ncbi:DNA polymerase epsilon subunit 3 isoform X2 [Pistacia vera]|uniref:DNA polymerase epsilon subunit 3 isoform X2 n=1 Tax=Pistacia vera TaxID=55513 RepID=UPI001263DD9E|nr:DNA polymerase epsilon subunit 3 isoform X2 [Pistacia vera]
METEKVVSEMEELPKTIVRRVVKDKLNECSPDTDITVNKDSLLAFSESARIFIHYLSATANDICKESKRQTINADDVLKAIEEIDFPEFVGPLKASLDVIEYCRLPVILLVYVLAPLATMVSN